MIRFFRDLLNLRMIFARVPCVERLGKVCFMLGIRIQTMTPCYNCEGQGKISLDAIPICPDCLRLPILCECGSIADLLPQFKIVKCPLCKGSGERLPFQTGFLFQ